MEKLMTLSRNEVVLAFAASCVESIANALSRSYKDIYLQMKAADMFNKIIFPHYETLHAESREVLTSRLIEALRVHTTKSLKP